MYPGFLTNAYRQNSSVFGKLPVTNVIIVDVRNNRHMCACVFKDVSPMI